MPSFASGTGFARITAAALCLTSTLAIFARITWAEDSAPPAMQIFRASDWRGGTDVAFEACKANSGEYTLWVYAKGETCGVPREQADRVVMFRQPLPRVSPLRAVSRLPGGSHRPARRRQGALEGVRQVGQRRPYRGFLGSAGQLSLMQAEIAPELPAAEGMKGKDRRGFSTSRR
jgi:hypothetical protein